MSLVMAARYLFTLRIEETCWSALHKRPNKHDNTTQTTANISFTIQLSMSVSENSNHGELLSPAQDGMDDNDEQPNTNIKSASGAPRDKFEAYHSDKEEEEVERKHAHPANPSEDTGIRPYLVPQPFPPVNIRITKSYTSLTFRWNAHPFDQHKSLQFILVGAVDEHQKYQIVCDRENCEATLDNLDKFLGKPAYKQLIITIATKDLLTGVQSFDLPVVQLDLQENKLQMLVDSDDSVMINNVLRTRRDAFQDRNPHKQTNFLSKFNTANFPENGEKTPQLDHFFHRDLDSLRGKLFKAIISGEDSKLPLNVAESRLFSIISLAPNINQHMNLNSSLAELSRHSRRADFAGGDPADFVQKLRPRVLSEYLRDASHSISLKLQGEFQGKLRQFQREKLRDPYSSEEELKSELNHQNDFFGNPFKEQKVPKLSENQRISPKSDNRRSISAEKGQSSDPAAQFGTAFAEITPKSSFPAHSQDLSDSPAVFRGESKFSLESSSSPHCFRCDLVLFQLEVHSCTRCGAKLCSNCAVLCRHSDCWALNYYYCEGECSERVVDSEISAFSAAKARMIQRRAPGVCLDHLIGCKNCAFSYCADEMQLNSPENCCIYCEFQSLQHNFDQIQLNTATNNSKIPNYSATSGNNGLCEVCRAENSEFLCLRCDLLLCLACNMAFHRPNQRYNHENYVESKVSLSPAEILNISQRNPPLSFCSWREFELRSAKLTNFAQNLIEICRKLKKQADLLRINGGISEISVEISGIEGNSDFMGVDEAESVEDSWEEGKLSGKMKELVHGREMRGPARRAKREPSQRPSFAEFVLRNQGNLLSAEDSQNSYPNNSMQD
jgi:hypothetical protein